MASGHAHARKEKEDLEHCATTLNLIKPLVQEGVVSQEKADALVRAAERGAIRPAEVKPAPEKTAAASATAMQAEPATVARPETKPATDSKVVRLPYVPEVVKNEIRDQVKEEVIAQAKAEHWAEPNAMPE